MPQGEGEGPASGQQFILVPIPQDQAQQDGDQQEDDGRQQDETAQQPGSSQQQGGGQQAQAERHEQMRDRAEAVAMDLHRQGYRRGVADAQGNVGAQIDPAAMKQIGREIFERGYMLGIMQARAQMAAGQTPQSDEGTAGQGAQTTEQSGTQPKQPASQAQQEKATPGGEQSAAATSQQQENPASRRSRQRRWVFTTQRSACRAQSREQYDPYLTDNDGRAVYLFTADKQAQGDAEKATSACYGDCVKAWSPVLTQSSEVNAMGEVDKAKLGTIEREDGTSQVTYDGWPLYYYDEDEGQAETTGQDVHGFGGEWYLVTPEGAKVGEG